MSRDEIVELMARAWNNNEWLWSKNALCIIGNNPARLEALKERELAKALAALTALEAAERQLAEARGALKSIASNTCCGSCQEAALVARAALGRKE